MPLVRPEQDGDVESVIRQAASALGEGRIVAIPTETVYGVAARADLPDAVRRLRRLKQRPDTKPFTLHIAQRRSVDRYVPDPGPIAQRIMRKGWPGPLTLVFKDIEPQDAEVIRELGPEVAAQLYHSGSIGIRFPDHDLARKILDAAAGPVVAASANEAGELPACTADEVMASMGDRVALVVDGGRVQYSKPSTVVEVGRDGYRILRAGVYDERTLKRLVTLNFLFVCSGNTCRSPMAQAIARQLIAERLGCGESDLDASGITIESAGTSATLATAANDHAIEAVRKLGLDLSGHRSRPLTVELVHKADYIFTMTRVHRDEVMRLGPSLHARVETLAEEGDIEDPIGMDLGAYEACGRRIRDALESRLKEVEL